MKTALRFLMIGLIGLFVVGIATAQLGQRIDFGGSGIIRDRLDAMPVEKQAEILQDYAIKEESTQAYTDADSLIQASLNGNNEGTFKLAYAWMSSNYIPQSDMAKMQLKVLKQEELRILMQDAKDSGNYAVLEDLSNQLQ